MAFLVILQYSGIMLHSLPNMLNHLSIGEGNPESAVKKESRSDGKFDLVNITGVQHVSGTSLAHSPTDCCTAAGAGTAAPTARASA